MIINEEDHLEHYGTPRKSGRYEWGSGENPYQRNQSFLSEVSRLRKEGMSDTEIARGFGITTTQLRAAKSIARNENRQADINQAQRLKDKGYSNVAIGDRMGINESSVRSLLAPGAKDRADVLTTTSNMLKEQLEDSIAIDIGEGVEHYVGVSGTRLKTAVAVLEQEGYKVRYVKVQQLGTGKYTTVKVLTKPDLPYRELAQNADKIKLINAHTEDGGRSYLGVRDPISVDSKRIEVRYLEDGGDKADGVIYVRPGVEDLAMGGAHYAQVRIAVDGSHFLKGVAVYNQNMPAGKDLVFNTTKSRSEVSSDKDAMKPLKLDSDNPFGAVLKAGGQRGAMNIINEEGDWNEWTKTIASQVLSKQSPRLAKSQLDMTFEQKQLELRDIKALTNPNVRRKLLESFSDDADATAVQLKAAALPRQRTQLILPVNSMKNTEVYAPNFNNGEEVVLIRFPHGGIFEIPQLTVNNKHREARNLLGPQAKDAIGINKSVADRLSGADFDGDTVLVIPNNQGRIKVGAALEGLKDFDARRSYPGYEGMKVMTPATKQNEMGKVSNLITDMTIRGASGNEIARAVRHSMVVIDAEKHGLDYKSSAIDNGISQLKDKYQAQEGGRRGAATLISRARSEIRIPERKQHFKIDPATGKKIFTETGETYIDKKGKVVTRKEKVERLAVTDDAHTLSSGTPIERLYADHSNRVKGLANEARRELVATKNNPQSKSARGAYAEEVASLESKLNIALMNAPRERQAQLLANGVVEKKKAADPGMEPADLKKIKTQALAEMRTRTGANKDLVEITDREWEAIQAGAISNHKLDRVLNNTDLTRVKQLATPKDRPTMTNAKIARARSMAASGYTQAEIAGALGVSVSAITDAIAEGG